MRRSLALWILHFPLGQWSRMRWDQRARERSQYRRTGKGAADFVEYLARLGAASNLQYALTHANSHLTSSPPRPLICLRPGHPTASAGFIFCLSPLVLAEQLSTWLSGLVIAIRTHRSSPTHLWQSLCLQDRLEGFSMEFPHPTGVGCGWTLDMFSLQFLARPPFGPGTSPQTLPQLGMCRRLGTTNSFSKQQEVGLCQTSGRADRDTLWSVCETLLPLFKATTTVVLSRSLQSGDWRRSLAPVLPHISRSFCPISALGILPRSAEAHGPKPSRLPSSPRSFNLLTH